MVINFGVFDESIMVSIKNLLLFYEEWREIGWLVRVFDLLVLNRGYRIITLFVRFEGNEIVGWKFGKDW